MVFPAIQSCFRFSVLAGSLKSSYVCLCDSLLGASSPCLHLALSYLDCPCGSAGKESVCSVGDLGSIPGLGRCAGEGKGYPLQYSGLENSVDYSPMGSQRVRHDYLLIIITNDTSNSYHLGSYYCDLSTLFVLSHGKGLTPFSDKVTEAPVLRPPDAKN